MIIPRHEKLEQRARDLEKVIAIVDGATTIPTTSRAGKQTGHRSAEGDGKRMRAIPIIAEGVPGTVPGTNPLDALIQAEDEAERHATADAA